MQGGGQSSSGHAAPAASSLDTARAAPVQQNDPRYPAPDQQERALGPDQQRKAAKAGGNRKAIDTCKEIEKAMADRRHAEYLAFKEGRGSLLPPPGTLPMLPPAGTPLLPIPSSRMIPATLLTSSGTGL